MNYKEAREMLEHFNKRFEAYPDLKDMNVALLISIICSKLKVHNPEQYEDLKEVYFKKMFNI